MYGDPGPETEAQSVTKKKNAQSQNIERDNRPHSNFVKITKSPMPVHRFRHRHLAHLTLWILFAKLPASNAHSAFVVCSTPLPISGHGGTTTAGGGTVHLYRNGAKLECGSSITAGETLTLTTQGTSGWCAASLLNKQRTGF